ncbi:MAG: hypothetical protein GEU91_10695 [Rhizobiales bacterium]|nr:hypothetical protein [Hyphomicrobiales bacterium]
MMFLLKAAFWLGLVLVLLPTGSKKQAIDEPQIKAAEAASAATAAVFDLSQFCTRQPGTCAVGSQVATILGQRAQAGAIMVYEFVTERREASKDRNDIVPVRHTPVAEGRGMDRSDTTTGSIGTNGSPAVIPAALVPRPRPAQSHDTLTATDRRAIWRTPELRQETQLRAAAH